MKKHLKTLIKIIVSVGLIIYLITKKIDRNELISNFKLLDWRYLPLMILTIIVHYVISSFRWKSLLIHENSHKISRWYLFKLYFIGAFFNNIMPTSIGGDVYKVYRLGKDIDDPFMGFSSVFTERFTGILMLFLIGLLSLSKHLGWGVLVLLIWVISGFIIGFNVLRILSKKIKPLKKLYGALSVYKDHPKVLIFAMITSLAIQFLSISTQYLTFMALGVKLNIFDALMFFPLITLTGFFVPSINSYGVQDYLYDLFFPVGGGIAIAASIIYHMVRMIVSLLGGVFYALGKNS